MYTFSVPIIVTIVDVAWSYVLLKVIHLLQSNYWLIIKFILVVI
jgi:hypothetical protein